MNLQTAIYGKKVTGATFRHGEVVIEFSDESTLRIEADGPVGSRLSVEADVRSIRFNTDAEEDDD